jgi:hypothetical protein
LSGLDEVKDESRLLHCACSGWFSVAADRGSLSHMNNDENLTFDGGIFESNGRVVKCMRGNWLTTLVYHDWTDSKVNLNPAFPQFCIPG